jgi:hypothetical protein
MRGNVRIGWKWLGMALITNIKVSIDQHVILCLKVLHNRLMFIRVELLMVIKLCRKC